MTWFPKNTTIEQKAAFYTEVGLTQQEVQAYLTPFSRWDKQTYQLSMQADYKVGAWVEAENEQWKLDNPDKDINLSFEGRQALREKAKVHPQSPETLEDSEQLSESFDVV